MTVKLLNRSSTMTAGATALAPITWGTTYVTTTELLPSGRPLLVATMRVLPAGLALVAAGAIASRWRPQGADWRRTATLAAFNFGIFFPLLAVAVYRLPGGIAAAAGGLQPLLVSAFSWPLAGRRPRLEEAAVGCVAVLGVGLIAIRPGATFDGVGLLAAAGANVSFAIGVVLTKRYPPPSNRVAATGWQLLIGSAVLMPLTLLVEGAPPALSGRNLAGFAYLSLVGTALAFIVWFNGIRRLSPAAPPLLGLAAPITGAVLGWAILGQSLTSQQLVGFTITIGAIAYGSTVRTIDAKICATPADELAELGAPFEQGRGLAAGRAPWRSRGIVGPVAPTSSSMASRLTTAELRVAVSIARGRTNRQVADELYLSPKAVVAHFDSILPKLGVRDRGELTQFVIRDMQQTTA